MTSKPRPFVAFDLDDTILDFVNPAYALLNRHFGFDHNPSTQRDYQMAARFDLTNEEMNRFLLRMGLYDSVEPFPGIPEALNQLSTLTNIHLITRRGVIGGDIEDVTRAWLNKHGIPYHRLTMLDKDQGPKVHYLCANTVAFFEDNVEEMSAAREIPMRFFVKQPWNEQRALHAFDPADLSGVIKSLTHITWRAQCRPQS